MVQGFSMVVIVIVFSISSSNIFEIRLSYAEEMRALHLGLSCTAYNDID